MAKDEGGRPVSRRDFLRIFPGLMGRKAAEFKAAIPDKVRSLKPAAPAAEVRLPAFGEVVNGIPLLHPWIGAARAIAARHARPRSLPFLLGATGEAFSLFWSPDDPAGAAGLSPGNTFLLALALVGISARAASGGPFEPALGGVEVAIGKGLTAAIGTREGPAVVLAVDRKAGTVRLARPGAAAADVPFSEFGTAWEETLWPGGAARFLRVTAESGPDRPRSEVLPAALPASGALLGRENAGGFAAGPAAWRAIAAFARAGSAGAPREILTGTLLPRAAVARRAAGDFLEEIGPIVAAAKREAVAAAARILRDVHAPPPDGGVCGTGLLPEAIGALDAAPERAAALFEEIADREARAAELLR